MNQEENKKKSGIMKKEVFVGILAFGLGSYNLLGQMGYLTANFEVPQMIANIILVISAFFLWIQAAKIARHNYFKRGFSK